MHVLTNHHSQSPVNKTWECVVLVSHVRNIFFFNHWHKVRGVENTCRVCTKNHLGMHHSRLHLPLWACTTPTLPHIPSFHILNRAPHSVRCCTRWHTKRLLARALREHPGHDTLPARSSVDWATKLHESSGCTGHGNFWFSRCVACWIHPLGHEADSVWTASKRLR